MAFGCYVAICYPQKYSSILTSARTGRIGLAALCRCALPTVPPFVELKGLPFCQSHVPSHAYCLHLDPIKLVCADITFNNWYGFASASLFLTLVRILAFMPCILIARAILSIASQREHLKL
ncbi:hypothetical protein QYF61_002470 [Mycteria americana]|uniref:Uncharacterized protein n=1 Tax=Mycteria americana TaxID=33587 RepID=A0AAN7S5C2_MYCAM|nr:hypothetical protein QYF61_002470 [Mycteria americana]